MKGENNMRGMNTDISDDSYIQTQQVQTSNMRINKAEMKNIQQRNSVMIVKVLIMMNHLKDI